MKHVSILVPEGAISLSNLEATYKMFSLVNEMLERAGNKALFVLQMVGLDRGSKWSNGPFTIRPEAVIDEIEKTDLIIIPAVHGDIKEVLSRNKALIPWIIKQHRKGAELVSLCIGAFLLASTGLLQGKSCTTHWLMAKEFSAMFPEVDLRPYKILTDEGGIYTSGGAYSSLNLILYLIEKYAGRDIALQASKIFEIDIDRSSQSPFIIFQAQKEHGDELIKKAQDFIERHFSDKITVDSLAVMLALGRRNLERRFKKATSNTVVEYIQRVKIEAAKKSFESSRKNISEVMYDVGYVDSKAFRTVFKNITGLSPAEYRGKYNKGLAA